MGERRTPLARSAKSFCSNSFCELARQFSLAAALSYACIACGGGQQTSEKSEDSQAIVAVAAERAPGGGGRLVAVSENGNRLHVLTPATKSVIVVDRSPVFIPSGEAIVFASNRDRRKVGTSSLWIVPMAGGPAKRITRGEYTDRDPRISADGKWLYFCSDREGHLQLFRAPLSGALASLGAVERITNSEGEVMSPSISPDGSEVVYMEIDASGESTLWKTRTTHSRVATQLTQGPLDMAPSWSSTGQIAFSARAEGRSDMEIYLLGPEGSRTRVVDSVNTDETGARWSQDSRFLFAIGMYRSAVDGKPLLGSVIYVDMKEPVRSYRVLQDHSAVESRIGLAVFPDYLDPAAMRRNPKYHEALQKVILQEALRNEAPLRAPPP